MILYKISAPMNKIRFSIVSGCIAGLLFWQKIFLKDLFAITSMTKECIMLFVFAIATEPVLRYLTTLVEKVEILLSEVMRQKICLQMIHNIFKNKKDTENEWILEQSTKKMNDAD